MHLIILVEDSKPDAELLKTVIEDLDKDIEVIWTKNGEECISYLSSAEFSNKNFSNERKILMLVDLNMPKINGIELLTILAQNQDYQKIPKIVYTTSNSSQDIQKAYEKGALSYVIKPFDLDEVTLKINSLIQYWLEIVTAREIDIRKGLAI